MGRMPNSISVEHILDAADCLREACETLKKIRHCKTPISTDELNRLIKQMTGLQDAILSFKDLFPEEGVRDEVCSLNIAAAWFGAQANTNLTIS